MNNIVKVLMILIMTISGSFGAFFFKRGVGRLENTTMFNVFWNLNIYIGGFFYVSGALLNIILLSYMDYTVVYPMTSLTYIWSLIISHAALKEKLNMEKVFAVACICIGVLIIAIF